jgi:dTDP-4-dehydrorhamnose reductase
VGLVHHGSGPRHTSLLDPSFPEGLAMYARRVAERYPWVEDWTPVNEPLTTARFSGLYGHWYPHHRDAASFVRALIHQCKATVLAMKAIRAVNPRARLVQTEDFGKTYSTETLAYQARHENHRRLLSIDLLCGRVGPGHPLHGYLLRVGATERELAFFQNTHCVPDVIGVNYYVTSDRFLDERLEGYPAWCHGGNGRHRYADLEAARVRAEGIHGHPSLLSELFERYERPVAITEAHLGGAREEQLRWFLEAWSGALAARERGVPVLAVTAWSLLGAFDWDCLVTRERGCYEPGAFDVRTSPPRPTALASLLRALAGEQPFRHPVTSTEGWWRRPVRLLYPAVNDPESRHPDRIAPAIQGGSAASLIESVTSRASGAEPEAASSGGAPLLIAGAHGTLGRAFGRLCALRGLRYRLLGRAEMDIADLASVRRAIDRLSPWAVINAAGYVRVDDAEHERDRCTRENVRGPAALATACAERSVPLATFSSDLVFSGAQSRPYVESDDVAPLGVYGLSKALGEREVMRAHPGALVVRTGAFFGPWDEHNFVTVALRALSRGRPLRAASDAVVSPTYVPDLVNAALDLLVDSATGLWHIANRGEVTWADLARKTAELAGLDASCVIPCPTRALGLAAPRPAYSALGTQRGVVLPALEESLSRYLREREHGLSSSAAA